MQRSVVRPSPLFLGILAVTVLGGVLAAVGVNETILTAGVVLLVAGGWVLSLCLHEFGHAFVAYRGGDYSVRGKGYLTLDPRHYTDPVLSLLLPLLFLIIGGIPLPGGAVWINHHALRDRRVESLVSLAGPLINLVIGILLSIVVAVVNLPLGLAAAMSYLALLQVITFVLNILPIPGFDGYGALEPYLSPEAKSFGEKARPWAPLILFVLLFSVAPVRNVLFSISMAVFSLFHGSTALAGLGAGIFQFWR